MNERRCIVLVYQAGIANVFEVSGDTRKRLLQSDFRTCEAFAHGCGAMGAQVATRACNKAGDIAGQAWDDHLDDQPFSDKFRPVVID